MEGESQFAEVGVYLDSLIRIKGIFTYVLLYHEYHSPSGFHYREAVIQNNTEPISIKFVLPYRGMEVAYVLFPDLPNEDKKKHKTVLAVSEELCY